MQENRIVWNVAFNPHVQSLVLEIVLFYMPIQDSTIDVSMKEIVSLAKYENWLLGLSLTVKRIGGNFCV